MGTTHAEALRRVVRAGLRDAQWRDTYGSFLARIYAGDFEGEDGQFNLLSFALQRHADRGAYSMEDAYVVGTLFTWQVTGQLVTAVIEVGHAPCADSAVEENGRALRDLAKPFAAEFWGGRADSDGLLRWNAPIELLGERCLCASNCSCNSGIKTTACRHETVRQTLSSGTAPLEVGTTEGSRTLLHLGEERRLARWPYGSRYVMFAANLGADDALELGKRG